MPRLPARYSPLLCALLLAGGLSRCGTDPAGGTAPHLWTDVADDDASTPPDATDDAAPDEDGPGDASGTDLRDGPPDPDDVFVDVAPDDAGDDDADDVADDDAADADMPPTDVDSGPAPCPAARPPAERGPDLTPGGFVTHTFTRCLPRLHTAVVPMGATWRFDAESLPDESRLYLFDATYFALEGTGVGPIVIARSEASRRGRTVSVTLEAPRSGEYVVLVERDDLQAAGAYQIRTACTARCEGEATRYPLVFVHGYAGVDSYFGVLDYFFGIDRLMRDRGYDAHFPATSPIATSERRAGQLAEQVDAILEASRARRVNVIAHSQGGLDARYLISTLGYHDRVATLTTVATPHRGIPLRLAEFLSVHDFSPEATERFNDENPDHPDVAYYSWSARTCGLLDRGCRDATDDEVVNAFLSAPFLLLNRFGDNDGIVPTASMPWGEHLGRLSADHFDEVGQIAKPDRADVPFNHRAFYLGEARRLRDLGF